MTIAVDLGHKATKQTNQTSQDCSLGDPTNKAETNHYFNLGKLKKSIPEMADKNS